MTIRRRLYILIIATCVTTIATTLYLRILPPLAEWELCSPGNCTVQAWVSALSGWVAALAAYLTIRTMNRQTAEANRHQRENVELQVLRQVSLARQVIDWTRENASLYKELVHRIEDYGYSSQRDTRPHEALAAIKFDVVEEFDREIGIMDEHLLSRLYEFVQDNKDVIATLQENRARARNQGLDPLVETREEDRKLAILAKSASKYILELQREALDFVEKWSKRMSH